VDSIAAYSCAGLHYLLILVFEVIHLILSFTEIRNCSLNCLLEPQLERALMIIGTTLLFDCELIRKDEPNVELKSVFVILFDVLSDFHRKEGKFILELKLQVHFNSLIAHLLELSSQLPEHVFFEIMETTKANGSIIDLLSFKTRATVNTQ
jgi:hypothetical protein